MDKLNKVTEFGMTPFNIGHLFHPLTCHLSGPISPAFRKIVIRHPMRLNAMLLDYSQFATSNRDCWPRAGSVPFAIDMFCEVHMEIAGPKGNVEFHGHLRRPSVVLHAIRIMQSVLSVNDGLRITIPEEPDRLHVGLGSSPTLQSSIAFAMNTLYGNKLPNDILLRYLIGNYGEEIDGETDLLLPVQAMGAAAAVGLFGGGMLVLSGNAAVVARMQVPETHSFVIATTRVHHNTDAATQLSEDINTYEKLWRFSMSNRYEIAYDVLNSMLPAMLVGDLREIGEVIARHRLSDKQIQRYKERYPQLAPIPALLRDLFRDGIADVVSISSTGPTAFALTTRPEQVREIIGYCDLVDVIVASPNNVGATKILTVS